MLFTREQTAAPGAPIGLPAGAFVIRNSGRILGACPKRWWFRVAEGLVPKVDARALSYGTAWHATLEDVHRTWMRLPGSSYEPEDLFRCAWCGRLGLADPGSCPRCKGTGAGPVNRAATEWHDTDREGDTEALSRAAIGWLIRHGTTPPEGFDVVAVELGLSMPIRVVHSSRRKIKGSTVYEPELYVVRAPDGRERLARTGEALPGRLRDGWECVLRRCPAHVSSRLDLALREGSALWVGELKSSQDPHRYLMGLNVDPQVATYELVLQEASDRGLLGAPSPDCRGGLASGLRVAGWVYDVSSSRLQRDPKLLKGRARKDGTRVGAGAISTAANNLASVPSWRLRASLDAAERDEEGKRRGLTDAEAEGLVSSQEEWVDRKFYARETGSSGVDRLLEVRIELLGEARRMAAFHRAAARCESAAEVAEAFPRIAVCRAPGAHCAYRGPCFNDSPEAREGFTMPSELRELWAEEEEHEEREAETEEGGWEDWS